MQIDTQKQRNPPRKIVTSDVVAGICIITETKGHPTNAVINIGPKNIGKNPAFALTKQKSVSENHNIIDTNSTALLISGFALNHSKADASIALIKSNIYLSPIAEIAMSR